MTRHPANTAKHVAQIAAGFRRNRIERIECAIVVPRRTGLDDRKLVAAEMLRSAPCAGKILGADPLVHARTMVFAREQVVEMFECVGFRTFRQFIRPPGMADQISGTVTVAFSKQHPRKREAALGASRLIAYEVAHGGSVAALLPQTRLGPLAHEPHARPARIISDECRESGEVRVGLRVAQDEPFDKLSSSRVTNRFL